MARITKYGSALAVGIVILAGCSQGQSKTATTTVTVSGPTSTTTTTVTPSTSETPASPESSSDTTSLDTSSETETEPDRIIRAARPLTLEDAFSNSDWEYGSFTPVNSKERVPAFAATLDCNEETRLEFRVQLDQGQIVADIAQDLQSPSPNEEIEFTITADGRAVEAVSIKFKERDKISTKLEGVSVVVISATNDSSRDGSCQPATALLTSLRIDP